MFVRWTGPHHLCVINVRGNSLIWMISVVIAGSVSMPTKLLMCPSVRSFFNLSTSTNIMTWKYLFHLMFIYIQSKNDEKKNYKLFVFLIALHRNDLTYFYGIFSGHLIGMRIRSKVCSYWEFFFKYLSLKRFIVKI